MEAFVPQESELTYSLHFFNVSILGIDSYNGLHGLPIGYFKQYDAKTVDVKSLLVGALGGRALVVWMDVELPPIINVPPCGSLAVFIRAGVFKTREVWFQKGNGSLIRDEEHAVASQTFVEPIHGVKI